MEQDAIQIVNISRTNDDVVIHFETSGERINAYTLASALVGIADAAKAANADLNLGYEIEVVVEALGPGSFRAQLRGIYTKARNLFSDQRVQAVILNIVAAFIYERYLATKQEVRIEIHTTEVVIEHGQERVVIAREVYDATRKAERNPQFVRSVEKTLESIVSVRRTPLDRRCRLRPDWQHGNTTKHGRGGAGCPAVPGERIVPAGLFTADRNQAEHVGTLCPPS